jgi:hypothetical protein
MAVMDYTGMLIVAIAFNVAVCALVAASYGRSQHRQALADDLKDFCEDPAFLEPSRPSKEHLRGETAPGRTPAV